MADILPSIKHAVMRGTTPTVLIDIGFDTSELTALDLYFMQGNKLKYTKKYADCENDGRIVLVQLSQEDTYALSAKKRLEIRCRFKRNTSPVVGVLTHFFDVLDSGRPEEDLIIVPPPPPVKDPTYIRITTLPVKLQYLDGGTIDYAGIVVKAYCADDTEFCTVPFEELIFPISTAVAVLQIDGYEFDEPFTWREPYTKRTEDLFIIDSDSTGTDYYAGGLHIHNFPTQCTVYYDDQQIYTYSKASATWTHVYWAYNPRNSTANLVYEYHPKSNPDYIRGFDVGFATPIPVEEAQQTLPVQWIATHTGETLTDTFNITVT